MQGPLNFSGTTKLNNVHCDGADGSMSLCNILNTSTRFEANNCVFTGFETINVSGKFNGANIPLSFKDCTMPSITFRDMGKYGYEEVNDGFITQIAGLVLTNNYYTSD